MISTKPYLVRAIWQWCVDQGFTPYLSVKVDEHTRVPHTHVKDGEIVLNIGLEASHQLDIGNEFISFQARFNGKAQALLVPVGRVNAIYARENGQGMGFEVDETPDVVEGLHDVTKPSALASVPSSSEDNSEPPSSPTTPSGKPQLTRVK